MLRGEYTASPHVAQSQKGCFAPTKAGALSEVEARLPLH